MHFRRRVDVEYPWLFFMSVEAGKLMRKQKSGKIVNVWLRSMALHSRAFSGYLSDHQSSRYCMKRHLAKEWALSGSMLCCQEERKESGRKLKGPESMEWKEWKC